jgi:hypothetical protein
MTPACLLRATEDYKKKWESVGNEPCRLSWYTRVCGCAPCAPGKTSHGELGYEAIRKAHGSNTSFLNQNYILILVPLRAWRLLMRHGAPPTALPWTTSSRPKRREWRGAILGLRFAVSDAGVMRVGGVLDVLAKTDDCRLRAHYAATGSQKQRRRLLFSAAIVPPICAVNYKSVFSLQKQKL